MNPTKDEAAASLSEIDEIIARTRRTIGHGVTAPLLILWGTIWIIGYSITHFSPDTARIAWPVLASLGGIVSWVIGARSSTPTRDRSDAKVGVAWVVLFLFAALWFAILLPPGTPSDMTGQEMALLYNRKLGAYLGTVPMLAYIILGLWFGRFLTILGSFVTLLIAFGYFLTPDWSLLITGLIGGGGLILSGVFIRKLWI